MLRFSKGAKTVLPWRLREGIRCVGVAAYQDPSCSLCTYGSEETTTRTRTKSSLGTVPCVAGAEGIEPPTIRLTAECSTN